MNYDMENIAKGLVWQMYVDKLENMKKLKNTPYFARMDLLEIHNLITIIVVKFYFC